MSNAVFPQIAGITMNVDKIPTFSTQIQKAVSGKEYRSNLMLSPTYSIKLEIEFMRVSQSELQQIEGFFIDRQGSFDSFLLDMYDDNSVTDQIIGAANGVLTQFQIGRVRGSSLLEPCKNIHTLTNVKVNGVTKTLGTDFTVSSTGLITFGSAPSTGNITCSGLYYYRCRFEEDTTTFTRFANGFWENKTVKMLGTLGNKI